MTKVAICVPALDTWKAEFGVDLAGMIKQFVSRPELDGVEMELLSAVSSFLLKNRTILAEDALRIGATHILWLDCDMRFPPDTLIRLLAHKKPIVGANYRARNSPFHFTACNNFEKGNRKRVRTLEISTGLEPVDWMGLGVMLIETRVFEKIEKPWFMFTHEDGEWIGEDFMFFRRASAAGFQPHLDHDLSKEVRHTSIYELQFNSISD